MRNNTTLRNYDVAEKFVQSKVVEGRSANDQYEYKRSALFIVPDSKL